MAYSKGKGPLKRARLTKTFAATAGNGAVGTVTLFTITGRVLVHDFTAFCTTGLTEAAPTATISVGTASGVTAILNTLNAVDIDTNEWWTDTSPQAGSAGAGIQVGTDNVSTGKRYVSENIIATVGAQNITGGVIVFDVWYEPVTDNGALS